MTSGRWSREAWAEIERLFGGALDLEPDRRAAWLEAECADPALRAEVQRLLGEHDAAGDFLSSPDARQVARLVSVPAELETVGPYRVLRLLARGGMGVVYLARDERLGRDVALKCLPPWLQADPAMRRRFLAEARAASKLDHPNIATVHDVGETPDGGLFIAMSYYAGRTLAERVAAGPLEIAEVERLATQIAGGLAAAHSRGIVHRDIKPANVFITADGRAKILDFGIAKTIGGATTRSGMRLGTIAYMSPEQTRGEPVDARSDVWSLGLVLYEMLTGRRAFGGGEDAVTIHAIRHDDARPLGELRPDAPAALIDIVERCLAKEKTDRFASAAEIEQALAATEGMVVAGRTGPRSTRRRLRSAAIGAGVAVVVLVIAAIAVRARVADRPPGAHAPDPASGAATMLDGAAGAAAELPRLAVLPLADVGGLASDEYLDEGLTDELIARLSELPGLRVIDRASIVPYRGTDKPIAEIARELNAGVLLEGSVRKAGDRVLVTVQLVDGRSKDPLWSGEFDAAMADLVSVQTEIAEAVAGALGIGPGDPESVDLQGRPANRGAYLAYLRGRYFWNERTPEALQRATMEFQRALDLDPTYARAWAGLADTYELLASTGTLAPAESARMTRAAAERALEIDADLADAHAALGTVLTSYYWDWEAATRHFERALASNPSYSLARRRYASLLAMRGRFDDAIREARLAQELDPLSSYARAAVGYILYLARRYDEAAAHLEAAVRTDPEFFLTHLDLALVYLRQKRPDQAVDAAAEASRLSRGYQAAVGLLGHAYAVAGRTAAARAVLRELADESAEQHVNPFNLGIVHLGLGEHEKAIDYFEEAASQRAHLAQFLGTDPVFDPLRAEPRFQSILREYGISVPGRD